MTKCEQVVCVLYAAFSLFNVSHYVLKMDTNLQNTEQNNTYHETAESVNMFTCNAVSK